MKTERKSVIRNRYNYLTPSIPSKGKKGVLIVTAPQSKHYKQKSLRQVLDILRPLKLTDNSKPQKCTIGYDSIECLGHSILRENRLGPKKIKYWLTVVPLDILLRIKSNLFQTSLPLHLL